MAEDLDRLDDPLQSINEWLAVQNVLPQFVPRMSHKWDTIGSELGHEEFVTQLRSSAKSNEEKLQQILDKWLRVFVPHPRAKLSAVLRSSTVGLDDVAKDFEEAVAAAPAAAKEEVMQRMQRSQEELKRLLEEHKRVLEEQKRAKEELQRHLAELKITQTGELVAPRHLAELKITQTGELVAPRHLAELKIIRSGELVAPRTNMEAMINSPQSETVSRDHVKGNILSQKVYAPLPSDLPSVPSFSTSQSGATTADKGPSTEMEAQTTIQQESSLTKDQEAVISMLCFVVGGIQSLSVSSNGGILTLASAELHVPSGAILQGQALHVRYAILLDGPFSIPEGYGIVSTVLYINYDTSLVKKPLQLHLNHWHAGKDRQNTMVLLKATHVTDERGIFHFVKYPNGSFSDNEQFAVLELEKNLCCVAVAVERTGNLLSPCNCGLHLLKKVQPDYDVSFRLYVTFDDYTWSKVIDELIINGKGWGKAVTATRQVVTLQEAEDTVIAQVEPASGDGWGFTFEGWPTVPLRLVCDPVRNQPSDLKEMIEYEHYPPCIQMDLRYDHPEVRPRVVASVKVSTSHNPANSFHLAVKVPGAQGRRSIHTQTVHSVDLPSVPSSSSSQNGATTADNGPSPVMEVLTATQQVEQVLDHFYDRFIQEIEAKVIMFDLKSEKVIGATEVTTISQSNNSRYNSQFLYDHLLSKCDKDSFMKVCDKIMAVEGNPRMRKLGEDMKSMLANPAPAPCLTD